MYGGLESAKTLKIQCIPAPNGRLISLYHQRLLCNSGAGQHTPGQCFTLIIKVYLMSTHFYWLQTDIQRGLKSSVYPQAHSAPRVLCWGHHVHSLACLKRLCLIMGQCLSEEYHSCVQMASTLGHIISAPYHPSPNGLAGAYFKSCLKKVTQCRLSTQGVRNMFVYIERSTFQCTTGAMPTERLGWNPWRLDLVRLNMAKWDEQACRMLLMMFPFAATCFVIVDLLYTLFFCKLGEKHISGQNMESIKA